MIAKGVRFNAEKKQVGNYYSTKVCGSSTWKMKLVGKLLAGRRGLLIKKWVLCGPDMEFLDESGVLQAGDCYSN